VAAELLGFVTIPGFVDPPDLDAAAALFARAADLGSPSAKLGEVWIRLWLAESDEELRDLLGKLWREVGSMQAPETSRPPVRKRWQTQLASAIDVLLLYRRRLSSEEQSALLSAAFAAYFERDVPDIRLNIAYFLIEAEADDALALAWLLLPFAETITNDPRNMHIFITRHNVGLIGLDIWRGATPPTERNALRNAAVANLALASGDGQSEFLQRTRSALLTVANGQP
jgi:hypothetical protein